MGNGSGWVRLFILERAVNGKLFEPVTDAEIEEAWQRMAAPKVTPADWLPRL
jgi:hypothetical protein